jgi:trk system potassium uptake protein TrkH
MVGVLMILFSATMLPPMAIAWGYGEYLLGGMGVIVLAVALLPMLGIGGMQLFKAETPGPMKDEKLWRAP